MHDPEAPRGSDSADAALMDTALASEDTAAPLRARVRARLFGEPPQQIGRFEIERELGRGGMGVVYLAHDAELGRAVAIKLLHEEAGPSSGGKDRLAREARALAALSHINVVVVHEVGTHEGQLYVVMEYVQGPTLRQWVAEHRDGWRSVLEKYEAAGRGLAAAHAAGIVHRDFKPDNVLVGNDARVRVLDFGLAGSGRTSATLDVGVAAMATTLEVVDLTATGTVMGTPAYMAPEQHEGGLVDERSDQFSFCVALWEALWDKRPFSGTDVPELRANVLAGRQDAESDLRGAPVAVRHVLQRGLERDPAGRFDSMDALLDTLGEAVAIGRPRSRRLALAAGGAAIALGIVAVAVSLATARRSSTDPAAKAISTAVVPEPPAAAPEPPARIGVKLEILSRTAGVQSAALSTDRRRIAYREQGVLWLRELAGGGPRRVDLEPASPVGEWPLADGAWLTFRDNAWLRVDHSGNASVVGVAPASYVAWDSEVSPTGSAIVEAGPQGVWLWQLDSGDPKPRQVAEGTFFEVAWSPDGDRFAALRIFHGEPLRLSVFTHAGDALFESDLGVLGEGLVWFSPDRLGLFVVDSNEIVLQCLRMEGESIGLGDRTSDLRGIVARVLALGAVSNDALLLLAADDTRHLTLIDLEPSSRGQQAERLLGGGVAASDHSPVWLSDEEVAFVSDRFGGSRLLRTRVSPGAEITVLEDRETQWAWSDGRGGVVFGAGDSAYHRPAGEDAKPIPASRVSGRLACASPQLCIGIGDHGDLVTASVVGDETRILSECVDQDGCVTLMLSMYPDGSGFYYAEEGRRVVLVDAATGERKRVTKDAPADVHLLGAWPTGSEDDELVLSAYGPRDGHFEVLVYSDADGYRTAWRPPSTTSWYHDLVVSPDGRRLIVTQEAAHSEVGRLQLDRPCD